MALKEMDCKVNSLISVLAGSIYGYIFEAIVQMCREL